MDKVVLGLSGGVDSAVAGRLLIERGYEVHGLYLDITTQEARRDAADTAAFLGITLEVKDIKAELEEKVCRPFTESYLRGETPNPCIMCNPAVKFRNLIEYADRVGAKYIATGHYARAENGALYKGQASNDQSYMLCRILRAQLERLILPLGGFEKREVRTLAANYGIPVAAKPDSMEICFIPDEDYIGWISRRAEVPGGGPMLLDGREMMRHEGIFRYTVGQRIPGLYDGRKLYVAQIDACANTIRLALWEDLFTKSVTARAVNWLVDVPDGPIRANVRVRHTKWENPPCTVTPTPDGGMEILADEPLRAPAPGQSAVIYDGDRVLAGGYIL